MWDSGSTLTFITYKLARELKLKGVRVNLSLVTVGGNISTKESIQCKLRMIDANGEEVEIEALGLERISSPIEPVDMSQIASLLSRSSSEIQRPISGQIDILVGIQYAAYHPIRSQAVGHLLLYEGRFGLVCK